MGNKRERRGDLRKKRINAPGGGALHRGKGSMKRKRTHLPLWKKVTGGKEDYAQGYLPSFFFRKKKGGFYYKVGRKKKT